MFNNILERMRQLFLEPPRAPETGRKPRRTSWAEIAAGFVITAYILYDQGERHDLTQGWPLLWLVAGVLMIAVLLVISWRKWRDGAE